MRKKKYGLLLMISTILMTGLSSVQTYANPTAGVTDVIYDTGYSNPTQYLFDNYERQLEEEKEKKEDSTLESTNITLAEDNVFSYKEWELNLIAQIIIREARGESESGQRLVADVIFNRVDDKNFPNNVYDVLTQKNQFTDENTKKRPEELRFTVPESVKILVREEAINRTDPYVLYFTAGCYNPYCRPAYKVGNHYFGYSK